MRGIGGIEFRAIAAFRGRVGTTNDFRKGAEATWEARGYQSLIRVSRAGAGY